MVDSAPYGTTPATTPIGLAVDRSHPAGTGAIAGILAAPETSAFVRTWLGAALGRDPVLAYQEAATLAGMLELLTCEEARTWLVPALADALRADPETVFIDSLEVARALKPAAMVLQCLERRLPEPANCAGTPAGGGRDIDEE